MKVLVNTFLVLALVSGSAFAQEILLTPKAGGVVAAVPTQEKASDSKSEQKDKPDEKKRKPGEIVVTTVVEGLNNPFSVAVEKGTDRIFVAESGARRIVEIKDDKAVEFASDFPKAQFRGYSAGPLSVSCGGESVLLVGHDNESGEGAVTRLKQKPNSDDPSKMEIDRQTVTIDNQGGAKLGQISNVMLKHTTLYAITHGDKENGWVAVAEIKKEKVESLRPSIATTKRSNYPNPTCATVSPGGEYLVISQMGEKGEAKNSRLVFYTLQGKLLRNFEVELNDVVALAYSPSRKHLFAIDYNFSDPSKGALYKLIGKGADKCDVKKLQDISFVTSMAFDSSGTLWLTSLGGPPVTDGNPTGKLIKIEGLDDIPKSEDDEDSETETEKESEDK